jgi:hypothetical protein
MPNIVDAWSSCTTLPRQTSVSFKFDELMMFGHWCATSLLIDGLSLNHNSDLNFTVQCYIYRIKSILITTIINIYKIAFKRHLNTISPIWCGVSFKHNTTMLYLLIPLFTFTIMLFWCPYYIYSYTLTLSV